MKNILKAVAVSLLSIYGVGCLFIAAEKTPLYKKFVRAKSDCCARQEQKFIHATATLFPLVPEHTIEPLGKGLYLILPGPRLIDYGKCVQHHTP